MSTISARAFILGSRPVSGVSAAVHAADIAALNTALTAEITRAQAAEAAGSIVRLTSVTGTGDAMSGTVSSAQGHIEIGLNTVLRWLQPGTNAAADPTITIGSVTYVLKQRTGAQIPSGGLVSGRRYMGTVWQVSGAPTIRVTDVLTLEDMADDLTAALTSTGADLTAEIARAQAAEDAVAADLTAEVARAQAAEEAVAADLTAETTRAQAAEDAVAADLTTEIARAQAAESLIGSSHRPGDLASAYGHQVSGSASSIPGASPASVVIDAALGAALRVTSATYTAPRAPQPIEPGRVYAARYAVARAIDPSDPLGDAVQIGLQWMSYAWSSIGAVTRETISLTAAMGVQYRVVTCAVDIPGVDVAIPAAVRYARPWVRTYGTDHETRIGRVDLVDVTDAWLAHAAANAAVQPADLQSAIDALVGAAPGALDTLAELAAALGADENFAATMTAAMAAKAPLASPAFTGAPTAPTADPGTATPQLATTEFVDAVRQVLAGMIGAISSGLSAEIERAEAQDIELSDGLDAEQSARTSLAEAAGMPGVWPHDDWVSMTKDASGRPVRAIDVAGEDWRAWNGRFARSQPAIDLDWADDQWASLILDANGRPMRAMDVSGEDWRAWRGRFAQDVPMVAVADMGGQSRITIDQSGRTVQMVDSLGLVHEPRNGRLVPVGNTGQMLCAAAFGDSTTWGDELDDELGPSWQSQRWTTLLGQALGIPVTNRGANGQRAGQIVCRMGARLARAVVSGGLIPASGSVTLTGVSDDLWSVSGMTLAPRVVTLIADGGERVFGRMTRVDTTTYTWRRSEPGDAVSTAAADLFVEQGWRDLAMHTLIGMGINDEPGIVAGTTSITDVQARYRDATAACRGGYTVWGMLDRGVTEGAGTTIGDYIRDMERWLQAEYGANFCPVRQYLSSQRALDDAVRLEPGFVPSADDMDAVSAGCTPPSYRNAGVHLTARGHRLQALCLERHFRYRHNL